MLREFIEQLDKLPQKAMANCLSLDAEKPLIGIISAQNATTVAHKDLDEICQHVREGILASGASCKTAYVSSIDCTALHGTQSTKYDLPSRDLTANAVELICANDFYDGLVFVASEPNIVAGMLLGAIRVNIPCAFVCGGTMSPIVYQRKEHGFEHFFEQIAKIKTGRTNYDNIDEIDNALPLVCGTDCARYGANSFNCMLETVGLAVKGNGTASAMSVERKNIAYKTGELAVKFADDKFTPRRSLTQANLTNAVIADLACGGSSTSMLNIIAITKELGIKNLTFKTIGDLAKSTPLLLGRDDDSRCIMTQFGAAGGVYAVLKQLLDAQLIKGDVYVNDDVTLAEVLRNVTVKNAKVIRPADKCLAPSSPLRVIYGNVAESGAFVQYRGNNSSFTGTAKVYVNEEMAVDALLHREIKAGDVLVIRGEGPKSGPGMREIYSSLAMLKGFDLESKVAVITDGRIADFYNGFVVGHITPETGEQNLFGVLQDGDEIEISIPKGKISCDIKVKELSQRYRDSDVGVGNYGNFYLKNWAKTCSTAVEGCVYKKTK